ncbi:hypothetical protein EI534_16545 [Pseudomonas frederiksbergensis]|nr:hypothetical protein [Pseudomonas frederiksbergensis]
MKQDVREGGYVSGTDAFAKMLQQMLEESASKLSAIPCGSEPARDRGLTVNIDVECDGPIASRLAPTGPMGYWPK